MDRTPYRAEIDGLRAIAVIAVVVFHFFPEQLSGGFVGVDVFFVISGYLISGILLDSARAGTSADPHLSTFRRYARLTKEFYRRRIKRIFPALLAVSLVVIGYGWLVMAPDEFTKLGKHVLGNALFVENFVLYSEANYFDIDGRLKPFLHLWSLAVEEQFYLIWPLILFLVASWPQRFRIPLLSLLLVVIASFLYSLHVTLEDLTLAFYSPLSRVWELAVGGLIAYGERARKQPTSPSIPAAWKRELPGLAGLSLIAICCVLYSNQTPFPGLAAAMPTLGAAMIIAGHRQSIANRLLGSKAPVYVGLISYPLYLWHWPLLSFASILGEKSELSALEGIAMIGASVALAAVTYVYIEQPIRRGSNTARTLLASMIAMAMVGYAINNGSLLPKSSFSDDYARVQQIEAAGRDWDFVFPAYIDPQTGREAPFVFFRVEGQLPEEVVYFGDSSIEQYWPRVRKVMKESRTYTAVFITHGGCPPFKGVTGPRNIECDRYVREALSYIDRPTVKRVVIGAQWAGYFAPSFRRISKDGVLYSMDLEPGRNYAFQELKMTLDAARSLEKEIVFIAGIPVGEKFDPKSLFLARTAWGDFSIDDRQTAQYSQSQRALVNELLTLVKSLNYDRIAIIDPAESLCEVDECRRIDPDGMPIYKDGYHLRARFVTTDATFIDRTILK